MQKYTISEGKKTILAALLLATFIILDRFLTVNMQFLAINLSLIPIMLAGMILGWRYSILIGALGDFIGATFWPFGAYFPGFTFSVGLAGLIFGLFLYETPNKENKTFIVKSIVSTAIVLIIVNLLLDSLWLNIMYKKAFIYYIGARAITQIVLFPIYVASIVVLEKVLKNPIKKYLYRVEEAEEV